MEGISHLLDGQAELAEPILARVPQVAGPLGATPAASAALSEQALIAMERRQWQEAGRLAEEAVAVLRAGHLDDYAMAAFVRTVAARAALHLGDAAAARRHLARAVHLRPLLTSAMPTARCRPCSTWAASALDGIAGARAVVRQAGEIIRERPDLGALPEQAAELTATLDRIGQGTVEASSLTAAELRLLPLLSTHLTLLEIGERHACPATRSRPRPSRSTASSACPRAARRCSASAKLGLLGG